MIESGDTVRPFLKCGLLIVKVGTVVACDHPMQPTFVAPTPARDCVQVAIESDSTESVIPVAFRCAARVRVVCG